MVTSGLSSPVRGLCRQPRVCLSVLRDRGMWGAGAALWSFEGCSCDSTSPSRTPRVGHCQVCISAPFLLICFYRIWISFYTGRLFTLKSGMRAWAGVSGGRGCSSMGSVAKFTRQWLRRAACWATFVSGGDRSAFRIRTRKKTEFLTELEIFCYFKEKLPFLKICFTLFLWYHFTVNKNMTLAPHIRSRK